MEENMNQKTLEQLVEEADKGVKAIQELVDHPEIDRVQYESIYTDGRWFSTRFSAAAKDYLGFRVKPEPLKEVFEAKIQDMADMFRIIIKEKFFGKKVRVTVEEIDDYGDYILPKSREDIEGIKR